MDWTKAIDINRAALISVLDEIFAMLELVLDGTIKRLPQQIYHGIERLLRPAEAAVRRLIVISARGLKVKPLPPRPMPKGLLIVSQGTRPPTFSLFDPRKQFAETKTPGPALNGGPRIHSLDSFFAAHAPLNIIVDTSLDASYLCRRFKAVKHALETLPLQAMRMARWKARRAKMESAKFRSPLRPGKPPGHRERPKHDVDFVLKECHALAFDALREDSS